MERKSKHTEGEKHCFKVKTAVGQDTYREPCHVQLSSVGAGMVWGGGFFSSFWDRIWAE